MNYILRAQDQQIRQVMRHCGKQAQQLASESVQVSEKGPGDYVTNVDQILDQQLFAAFSDLFPHDGIITEENAMSRQAFQGGYSRLWCIDPLDGTEDFIQKKSYYAVMVGLLENFEPVAGWIYGPHQDRLYYGGKEWGLFQTCGTGDPQPLAVVEPAAPNLAACPIVLGDKDQENFGAAIQQQIPGAEFYSLGSFGLKVMEVIQGHAGLYLYLNGRVKLWDTTGPLALAKAAGLVCCDLEGHPLKWTPDVVDSQTLIHQQSIMIGWPHYVEILAKKIRAAVPSLPMGISH